MNANSLDCSENGPAKGKSAETTARNVEEVNLFVEESEDVIGVGEEITIRVENIEDLIASNLAVNHNETRGSDSE